MKTLKKISALVWVMVLAAVISGCASSTYHPVGGPREGVVDQKVVIN